MPNPKCHVCAKTAYPLESVNVGELVFHKGCFRCEECKCTLNLKNFKRRGEKVYCSTHTPTEAFTAVADSVLSQSAKNAPKDSRAQVGVQKGTGEKPTQILDTVTNKTALNAPDASRGQTSLQKGTGERPTQILDTVVNKTAMNAPKNEQTWNAAQKGANKIDVAGEVVSAETAVVPTDQSVEGAFSPRLDNVVGEDSVVNPTDQSVE
eukprot:TRINITY_DN2604_c0_g1_i2.p1 TRINITY_DN2604_c0_g1~~TRINITY_DN2604_c0_g1_i2.p1  ORF type:complete len:208 (-),score=49.81 TRINITY_DN2604_c0_g1_i2:245-868(-)